MKKSLLLLALSFLLARVAPAQFVPATLAAQQHGGGTAPGILQYAKCAGTNACTLTFTNPVGAGHRVFGGAISNGSTANLTMTGETVTHPAGCGNNAGFQSDCFLINAAAGGQTSASCTTGSSSADNCFMVEVSAPVGGASPLDASGNSHSVTTALSVSTSGANTVAGDITIAFFGGATPPFTVGAGYALSPGGASLSDAILVEYATPGTTTTQTATGTANAGTNNPGGIASLKP